MASLAPSFHHWQADQGIRLGNEIALMLGCLKLDIHAELECLKQQSALALMSAELDNGVISQPVIDWEYATNPFLPQDPLAALENGEFSTDVEVLLGTNHDEGLLITQIITQLDHYFFDWVINNWDIWGPVLLFHKHALEVSPDDTGRAYEVLEYYCGTVDVTTQHIVNMTEMFTDSYFLFGVTKYIDDYHLRHSSKPIYQYINTHHNEKNQVQCQRKKSTSNPYLR